VVVPVDLARGQGRDAAARRLFRVVEESGEGRVPRAGAAVDGAAGDAALGAVADDDLAVGQDGGVDEDAAVGCGERHK